MFAVLLTGPPGSGKTVALTALLDALAEDGVPHAGVNVDEVSWAFPFPDLSQRCDHLRAWRESHTRSGATLFVVAEVMESQAHLADVLNALEATNTSWLGSTQTRRHCGSESSLASPKDDSDWGAHDLIIAATALSNGRTVVTSDRQGSMVFPASKSDARPDKDPIRAAARHGRSTCLGAGPRHCALCPSG